MTQNLSDTSKAAITAFAILLSSSAATQAGPFAASEAIATPGGGNDNFVQLEQISGFTGQMGFNFVGDGGYNAVGAPFNKYIKLRFTVNCPAGYRVNEAGIRVRGNDVHNYSFELVSPGDIPVNQNTWEQALEQEPWDFETVKSIGIDAVANAGNNGPVYVSLNEVMDSRTEYYGSCSASDPFSGLPFLYYDSTSDNGHMRPMTRVRFQLQNSFIAQPQRQIKLAPSAPQRALVGDGLRYRDRAMVPGAGSATAMVPATPVLKAPGGCPYDCPPPARKTRFVK